MGQQQSGAISNATDDEAAAALENESSFSREDLNDLAAQFRRKYPNGFMTVEEFVRENMAVQGGTREFWLEVAQNFVDDDRIGFTDFIAGLSAITQGTKEEKLEWMFKLYDYDGNGVLDEHEVLSLVKGVLKAQQVGTQHWDDAALKAKAHALFSEMDSDSNGAVDRKEFVAVAARDEALCNALVTEIVRSTRVDGTREDFSTFDNQVAGHQTGNMAMLKDPSGKTIFKPMADVEFDFYVHCQKHVAPDVQRFLFPQFFGRKVVAGPEGDAHYIVLEDLTHGLEKPCIMDLKMGFRGHDDNARTLKVVQQVALCTYTTSSSLGFRLCGMRYRDDRDQVVVRGKPWGAKLNASTMSAALMEFVTQMGHIRFDVVEEILTQLKPFVAWFATQTLYKFYSSSILFVYDAASPKGKPKVLVKLVDFAHTYPNAATDKTLDTNFGSALTTLVSLWTNIASFGREIYENQRCNKGGAWSKDALLRSDRAPYSSVDGNTALQFTDPSCVVICSYCAPTLTLSTPDAWVIDKSNGSENGWLYAPSWKGPWVTQADRSSSVRRRRWVRRRTLNSHVPTASGFLDL